jgi:hypothetical protein
MDFYDTLHKNQASGGHPHIHTFQFSTMYNSNMTAALTSEVEVTSTI